MERKPKETVDIYKIVEGKFEKLSEKLVTIEQKVKDVERKTKKSFQNYQEYLTILSSMITTDLVVISRILSLGHLAYGKMPAFNATIKDLLAKEKKNKKLSELGFGLSHTIINRQMSLIIQIAKQWGTPFEDLASYLIKKLGKEWARKIVDKTSILEHYGKEAMPIWKSLLKE
ncbi:MAG: hypothetical protein PVF96_04955 [Candidatus Bathyarchaeota archaeon]|jgi:hypothetical protein